MYVWRIKRLKTSSPSEANIKETELGSELKIINCDSVRYIKEYVILFIVASHLQ